VDVLPRGPELVCLAQCFPERSRDPERELPTHEAGVIQLSSSLLAVHHPGEGRWMRRPLGQADPILRVCLCADGEVALTLDEVGRVRRWDLRTGLPSQLPGLHRALPNSDGAGVRFLARPLEGGVLLLDLSGRELRPLATERDHSAALLPGADLVEVVGASLRRVDPLHGVVRWERPSPGRARAEVRVTEGGDGILLHDPDGKTLRLLDPETGRTRGRWTWPPPPFLLPAGGGPVEAHSFAGLRLVLGRDGGLIQDGNQLPWRLDRGGETTLLRPAQPRFMPGVWVAPGGRFALTDPATHTPGQVRVWLIGEEREVRLEIPGLQAAADAAFLPGGEALLFVQGCHLRRYELPPFPAPSPVAPAAPPLDSH
jgi:hypothetical protein